MKYFKQQSTVFEYIPVCSQNALFTGSVILLSSDDHDDTTATTSASQAKMAPALTPPSPSTTCSVVIRTSCTLQPNWNSIEATATTFIQVQPLLVLDLNGILCHRIRAPPAAADRQYRDCTTRIAGTTIVPRPDLHEFLAFVNRHFCLAVWTSAKAKTARKLVSALVPPAIANQLLFIWAQHDCDSVVGTSVDAFEDYDNDDANAGMLLEKDLSKVWKEYPMWNASNTILMDDSPDKCTAWSNNAVHPPPLNGLIPIESSTGIADTLGLEDPVVENDDENVLRQRHFWEQMVQHWNEQPVEQLWQDQQDDKAIHTSNADGLSEFLKIYAVEHMGW